MAARGGCPVCGRVMMRKQDGNMAVHHNAETPSRHCEGSGQSALLVRRCGCVSECQGHLRGTDKWWEATIEMMDDMAAGRPIPEKFIVRPPRIVFV